MKSIRLNLLRCLLILSLAFWTEANAQNYEFNHLSSTLVSSNYNALNFDGAGNHYFFTTYGIECMNYGPSWIPEIRGVIATPGQSYEGGYQVYTDDDDFVVADGDAGITIVDVWDPGFMFITATLDLGGCCRAVAVQGVEEYYAFCAADDVGMVVVNTEDNANPYIVATYSDPDLIIHDIKYRSPHLYMAAETDGLVVLDVSDPATPQFTGQWSYPGNCILGMAFHPVNDSLYLALGMALGDPGVVTLDINDPTNPVLTGGLISTIGPALDVSCYTIFSGGNYYYYIAISEGAGAPGWLEIFWDEMPGVMASSVPLEGPGNGIHVEGNTAYIFEGSAGYEVFDVYSAYSITWLAHVEELGGPRSVQQSGNYAYVANYSAGMTVLDLADLANPDSVATVSTGDYCYDVAVVGGYVYAVDFSGELKVIDVTDPANPTVVYTVIGPEGYRSMGGWDGYLYVGSYFGEGVQIFDVDTNPAVPLYLGTMPAPLMDTDIEGVTAADGLLFLAGLDEGVYIYDLTDPVNPLLLANYQTTGEAHMVATDVNVVYTAAGSEGVLVLDVSDPANPSLLSTITLDGDVLGVTCSDGVLLVAHGSSGVSAYNVADPQSPIWLGSYDSPGQACEVITWGAGHVLLCDTYSLEIYEIEGGLLPEISLSTSLLDFGSVTVGTQSDLPLTVYNIGSDTLILYDVFTSDPVFTTDFNPADSLIVPGDSLAITVSFIPEEAITYSTVLAIENNDEYVTVTLQGEGIEGIAITLTPYSPPIFIPPTGGSFDFNIAVENSSPNPQTFDLWTQIELPGAGMVEVMSVLGLSLPSNTTIDRDRTQTVPANAPGGTYVYYGYVGNYPWEVNHFDSFTFEKLGDDDGSLGSSSDWPCFGESFDAWLTGVSNDIPQDFVLQAAYPNPFNPATKMSFALPEAGKVNLSVYDITGRLVAEIVDGWRNMGTHEVTFDASGMVSGIYIYHLQSGGFTASGKIVLMK